MKEKFWCDYCPVSDFRRKNPKQNPLCQQRAQMANGQFYWAQDRERWLAVDGKELTDKTKEYIDNFIKNLKAMISADVKFALRSGIIRLKKESKSNARELFDRKASLIKKYLSISPTCKLQDSEEDQPAKEGRAYFLEIIAREWINWKFSQANSNWEARLAPPFLHYSPKNQLPGGDILIFNDSDPIALIDVTLHREALNQNVVRSRSLIINRKRIIIPVYNVPCAVVGGCNCCLDIAKLEIYNGNSGDSESLFNQDTLVAADWMIGERFSQAIRSAHNHTFVERSENGLYTASRDFVLTIKEVLS
ncbi:MAG: hypothetical protein NZM26_01780 [Patescibacteria group bacterium]|nr:hypothetical protein [Patescibacteria group bacterium]